MNRQARLQRGISKQDRGLEIAPFFRPLVSRDDGFDVEVLDVLDQQALVNHARQHPDIPDSQIPRIGPVDHVMSANDIGDLGADRYDYVISSHNFEHLPNPIKFLQGAAHVLKPGGLLTLALPDFRRTLDQFRAHTLIGDWIEAYREERREIPARQGFETLAYLARDTLTLRLVGDLRSAYDDWDCADYRDIHVSVFCPASFELLIREAQALDLIQLTLEGVEQFRWEFHARLRNVAPEPFDIRAERQRLLLKARKQMRQRLPLILRAANLYGVVKRRLR